MKIKKLLYLMLVATMTATTSCSQDEAPAMPESNSDELQTIRLTAAISNEDALRSRSANSTGWYGSFDEANKLQFVMLKKTENGYEIVKTASNDDEGVSLANKFFTVSFTMPKSRDKYEIVFWVDAYGPNNPESPFTIDFANGTIAVDYSKTMGKFDYADAFFGRIEFEMSLSQKYLELGTTLKRPFAQICGMSQDIRNDDMKEGFPDGIRTTMYMLDTENNACLPSKWHWRSDKLEYTKFDVADLSAISMNFGATPPEVEYDRVKYDLWYMSYIFAPQATSDWSQASQDGTVPQKLV